MFLSLPLTLFTVDLSVSLVKEHLSPHGVPCDWVHTSTKPIVALDRTELGVIVTAADVGSVLHQIRTREAWIRDIKVKLRAGQLELDL